MDEIWRQIEEWLSNNAPEIGDGLLKGATARAISSAEKALGITFPDDVKESYRVHDGQDDRLSPLMGEWYLLSLKSMVAQWKIMKKLVDEGKFEGTQGEPVGPVKSDWYNLKWIPIAHNGGGDLQCLDMDPPSDGKVGQIVSFWHMDEKRERLASSFTEWLKAFASALETGKYEFDGDQLTRISDKRS